MENIETIYVEDRIKDHFRTKKILDKISGKRIIPIEHYSEIFNRKNQSFSLQKLKPALILAKKDKNFIQQIKPVSGVGLSNNYYFSVMLNCPFDCMYCFLQGFFRSAFYTLFVNYEDFKKEIEAIKSPAFFFAGYDCDSLAMDHLTEFSKEFIPFFKNFPNLALELRTKSINIKELLPLKCSTENFREAINQKEATNRNISLLPGDNIIIAFSLNPENIVNAIEKKAPPLDKRIKAIVSLQQAGWKIGLRFDPLILHEGYQESYKTLFETVFEHTSIEKIHSVTLGALRYPSSCYGNIRKINNKNPLLAALFQNSLKVFSYEEKKEEEMLSFCEKELKKYITKDKIFIYRDCS